jgi:two-component system CitB family sensor kinase
MKKFEKKVTTLSLLIALVPLFFMTIIFSGVRIIDERDKVSSSLLEVALDIANTPMVQRSLASKKFDLQDYADIFVKNNRDIDLVVIGDMRNIRYSHLDPFKVKKEFGTSDSEKVLKEGRGYYSLIKGSQGLTYRRFEPIFSGEKQVGFVMIGKYFNNFKQEIATILLFSTSIILLSALIIFGVSKKFAKGIKAKMLDLEPEEITDLYIKSKRLTYEQTTLINNIHEGVVLLGSDLRIININERTYKLIKNFDSEEFIERIREYLLKEEDTDFLEIIFKGNKIFISVSHLVDEKKRLSSIVTIYSHIDLMTLAEELTSINNIIYALREKNHEFKNQLQVIQGLIQLKKYDMVESYISTLDRSSLRFLTESSNICDYYVLGVLIGKYSTAKENGIELVISKVSNLYFTHGEITSLDIITIVANLIENSIEAIGAGGDNEVKGEIEVLLTENSGSVQITVADNGIALSEDVREKMFNRHYSTKGEGRGIGLALVRNKVELYNGSILIDENQLNKSITVILNKEVKGSV